MIYALMFLIFGLCLLFLDSKLFGNKKDDLNLKKVRPLKQDDDFNSNSINGCGLKLIEGERSGFVGKSFLHVYYQFFCLFSIPIIPLDCVIGEKRFERNNFISHKIYGRINWNWKEVMHIYSITFGGIFILVSIIILICNVIDLIS